MALIKKLRKKKKEAPANEKPDVVKTHLRNMVLNYTILYIHSILTVISGPVLMVISGHCPRDDRLHCWSLQRQGLHTGEAQKYCGLSESRSSFNFIIIMNLAFGALM